MSDVDDEMLDGQELKGSTAVGVSVTMVETTEVIETQAEEVNGSADQNGNVDSGQTHQHRHLGDHADREVTDVGIDRPATTSPRTIFLDSLKSPIVEIVVGDGTAATTLRAHRALLAKSPYFVEQYAKLGDDETAQVYFPAQELDAVGCLLQYLYTGEYFPKKLAGSRSLEEDPDAPAVDDTGEQLLMHARVYTLAARLDLPELQSLAHSKIHRINSTAQGEIAYARYVYSSTPSDDTTIRKPIAAFWAHRSHVLRHEAEEAFRKMCLDFPEFGFDVLSLVLDAKEKTKDKEHVGSSRKRARVSAATDRTPRT